MRSVLSRFKALVLLLVLSVVMTVVPTVSAEIPRITATQSILVEAGPDGIGALGTVVVDLALGPSWHITYIHDRGWFREGRHQEHDVSATRILAHDRTATLGWRVKIPEGGRAVNRSYFIWAWRWGG